MILVRLDPSPVNDVAVIIPVILTLPIPVISLPLRSKLPPNCGVVSSMILESSPASALAISTIVPPSRRYIFLSALFTANSPSIRSDVVGTDEAVLDLFGLKTFAMIPMR